MWGGKDVDGVHLLLGDAALPMGLIHLGAPEDYEAAIGLEELGVVLRGVVRWLASLWGWLLGLVLLAKGAVDVAPNGGIVFEEVLHLPLMEWAGGLERLLQVLWTRTTPVGLRPSGAVSHSHYLLPTMVLVLVPLITVMLGRSRVVAAIPTAEVGACLALAAKVGLDGHFSCGVHVRVHIHYVH